MSGVDPVQLRARAAALRALARRIGECPTGWLPMLANHETWLGPTADRCANELAANRLLLETAVEDLRARANALERQADAASPVPRVN